VWFGSFSALDLASLDTLLLAELLGFVFFAEVEAFFPLLLLSSLV
jgi:hypothetical protein